MATASKSNVWAQVEAILASHKVKTIVVDELKAILAPKNGGSVSNPSYIENGITMYFCRFHQRYEAECDMVMSQGKPKGYCKASISKWNKTNSQIKRLEAQAVGEMTRDNFDKARELASEAKVLGESLNSPENYDYEADWKLFNGQVDEVQA